MFYLVWVPLSILFYVGYAILTKQNNDFGGKWSYILFLYGIFGQIWVVVSRYSKNLLFDGVLYDFIIISSYVITMSLMGYASNFSATQWFGLMLAVIGMMMMKVSFV